MGHGKTYRTGVSMVTFILGRGWGVEVGSRSRHHFDSWRNGKENLCCIAEKSFPFSLNVDQIFTFLYVLYIVS